jgi:hypothetical protein
VAYEIAAVKLRKWFAGEERLFDPVSNALCWTAGTLVLNSWAFFSYYGVFTGELWANIGYGILEPPLDENDGAAGIARNNRNARGAATLKRWPMDRFEDDKARMAESRNSSVSGNQFFYDGIGRQSIKCRF